MATEYTITYTYTGQENTSGTRSVAFSKFKASGDTGRTIGQITSIKYEHWHTSTVGMVWNLRGRLVFSDGSTLTSNTVGINPSGDSVKFTNTFNTLPTAEKFAKLTTVQTLDSQGKTTKGGYAATLYWRATSDKPMRLIVKFIEEPPVVYSPSIETFMLQRCNEDAVLNDEGQYIAATMKLAIADTAGLEGAECRIYYSANTYPVIGTSQYIDVTSQISTLLTGVNQSTEILTGVWGLGYQWHFAIVFIAGEETAMATTTVARGTTSLHISGEPGGGVAVGGFSSGTSANPKFESAVPAYFYKGIEGVTNYSTEEVATGGTWIDGKAIYRRTFKVTNGAATTDVTLGTISNLSEVISTNGYVKYYSNHFSLSFYRNDTYYHRTQVTSAGKVLVHCCQTFTAVVTVEYTKTTG